jgi:predicted acyl esterase
LRSAQINGVKQRIVAGIPCETLYLHSGGRAESRKGDGTLTEVVAREEPSSAIFAEYKADAIHRWEFALEPTSTVFAPGERVRLEIAGGAFPLYDRNPSNATRPSEMSPWNWGRSTHMVYHDAEHASALMLPVTEVTV